MIAFVLIIAVVLLVVSIPPLVCAWIVADRCVNVESELAEIAKHLGEEYN